MYKKLKDNESFSDIYATWIIAYCLDTDSFFATNQRHFFWEYNDEFQCENDAVNYFRNHTNTRPMLCRLSLFLRPNAI